MADPLAALQAELERFGAENDAAFPARERRMLNVTRDTGELLAVLVRATTARRVLEVGTSNGYSTLWLAEAASALGGRVTTLERAADKVALATANFARGGLAASIDLVHGDAGEFLDRTDPASYDLIFLDSERSEYPAWWPFVRRALRPGGLLVVDNATSHRDEMAPFAALVTADPAFTTCLATVGKGELLAVKQAS